MINSKSVHVDPEILYALEKGTNHFHFFLIIYIENVITIKQKWNSCS
jgi:hypothetical protein